MLKARLLNMAGWLCVIAAALTFLYYWDPSRIYVMQLKGKNDFAYKPLSEEFTSYDIKDTLKLSGQDDVSQKRDELSKLILSKPDLSYKPYFTDRLFHMDKPNKPSAPFCFFEKQTNRKTYCQIRKYKSWANLEQVDSLTFQFKPGYVAKTFLFSPEKSIKKLVIYYHGYAGTFHDHDYYLEDLIERGFHVLAMNMPSYGDNDLHKPNPWMLAMNGQFDKVDYPLDVFLKPVFGSLNFTLEQKEINHIAMVGLSAGAWVTSLAAALDERIKISIPVAGILPIGLRQGDKERAAPQFYSVLLEAVSYGDLFVMATSKGRKQLQIFNRYDRCCFNNVRGSLYEADIQKLTAGRFNVLIDETHARHKISGWAFDRILQELNKGEQR